MKDVAEAAAGSAADAFFELIANGARDLLKTVSTFWLEVPDPEVAKESGGSWVGMETITSVQAWISPVGLFLFLVTVAAALLRVGFDTRRAGETANGIVRALVVTLAAGLPLLALTMLGLQFGDAFSPWILEQASGEDTSDGFGDILAVSMFGSVSGVPAASGALLIIYLLAILGAIMQVFFMIVRGAAIITLLCFAQVTAAGTATEEGWLRFKRLAMLIFGFVLYKPVAAVIYAVGLKLLSDGGDEQAQILNSVYGLTVMLMAALALPAVIKFVAPPAAMGSSSAFSGGAAAGMVATGATMVALAGTGGGSAAAGSAGGAGLGGGGGGMPPGGGGPGGGGGQPSEPGAGSTAPLSGGGDSDGSGGMVPSGDGVGSEQGSGSGDSGAEPQAPAAQGPAGVGAASAPDAGSTPPQTGTDASGTQTDTGGRSGGEGNVVQLGAGMVQNLAREAGQAGDEAARDGE